MDLLLSSLLAVCSIMGFVNVRALWQSKVVCGVSLWPSAVYSVANIVQAFLFAADGHVWAAIGSILCLVANAVWLGLALFYQVVRPVSIAGA
jgi:hypothetical protein